MTHFYTVSTDKWSNKDSLEHTEQTSDFSFLLAAGCPSADNPEVSMQISQPRIQKLKFDPASKQCVSKQRTEQGMLIIFIWEIKIQIPISLLL